MGKFDVTPRTPRWAEDEDGVLADQVLDPGVQLQNVGLVIGTPLSAEIMNWLHNHHGTWLAYLHRMREGTFDRPQLVRNGGKINHQRNGGTWTFTMASNLAGWTGTEAFFLEAPASVSVTPDHAVANVYWVVATPEGLALRQGGFLSDPTPQDGDVPLYSISLSDSTTTAEGKDLRQVGVYRGGRVVAENQLRAGAKDDILAPWRLEVNEDGVYVRGEAFTVSAAKTTVSSDEIRFNGDDIEIGGRTVEPAGVEQVLNVAGEVFRANVGWAVSNEGLHHKGIEDWGVAAAVLDLPPGATITGLWAFATGVSADSEITVSLRRRLMQNSESQVMASVSGSGSGALDAFTDDVDLATLDQDRAYFLHVETPENGDAVTLHGCRVLYQMPAVM